MRFLYASYFIQQQQVIEILFSYTVFGACKFSIYNTIIHHNLTRNYCGPIRPRS